MNRISFLFLAATSACTAQIAGNRHLILISVDGMRPIEYHRQVSYAPTIQALAQTGCAANGATSVFPTVTYPNHTAMVTGQPPAISGILSNNIFDPFNLTYSGWYWYAEQIKTPTLWQVVKAAGGTTAAVNWPVTAGAEIDYLIPEYREVRHPDDLALLRAISSRGLIQAVEERAGPRGLGSAPDTWKGDAASFIFEKYKPNLLLLHLTELDHEQHIDGVDSPNAIASLRHIDTVIQKMKTKIEAAAGSDPVTWIIVSDHGFQKIEKQFNPKVAVRELGYVTYGKQGALESWRVYPRTAAGMFALVAKDPNDTEAIERTRKYFEFLSHDPKLGIRKLYSREDLARMHAFSDAFLAGDMAEGFSAGDSSDGALITPSANKGTHGFDPENPNMRASFLAVGAGVARCSDLPGMQLLDVAPTAAALLGIKFPESTGHARKEVLSPGK